MVSVRRISFKNPMKTWSPLARIIRVSSTRGASRSIVNPRCFVELPPFVSGLSLHSPSATYVVIHVYVLGVKDYKGSRARKG